MLVLENSQNKLYLLNFDNTNGGAGPFLFITIQTTLPSLINVSSLIPFIQPAYGYNTYGYFIAGIGDCSGVGCMVRK